MLYYVMKIVDRDERVGEKEYYEEKAREVQKKLVNRVLSAGLAGVSLILQGCKLEDLEPATVASWVFYIMNFFAVLGGIFMQCVEVLDKAANEHYGMILIALLMVAITRVTEKRNQTQDNETEEQNQTQDVVAESGTRLGEPNTLRAGHEENSMRRDPGPSDEHHAASNNNNSEAAIRVSGGDRGGNGRGATGARDRLPDHLSEAERLFVRAPISGVCFHTRGCTALGSASRIVACSRAEARNLGLRPCLICLPQLR